MFWNWITTSLSSAALVGVGAWLARSWIKERLAAAIRTETETRIATVRDQLHRETETELAALRTRLDAAETRLADARRAGLDANQQLYAAVAPERIAAIKALWSGVIDAGKANVVSNFVNILTPEMMRKEIRNERFARNMKEMLDNIPHMDLITRLHQVNEWRPFVSERAWALYSAHTTFYTSGLVRGFAIAHQLSALAEDIWQTNGELTLVRATAPTEIANRYAANAYHGTQPFVEYVQKELLAELRGELAGKHSGAEALREAQQIIAAVDQVQAANSVAQKAAVDAN